MKRFLAVLTIIAAFFIVSSSSGYAAAQPKDPCVGKQGAELQGCLAQQNAQKKMTEKLQSQPAATKKMHELMKNVKTK